MSDERPDPLVPAEVDLRGLEYMPYYGDRLRESGLNSRATDAEYRAAHNLWWSSWKQTPAASLPTDDVELCKLADLGRDLKAWAKVKVRALHGFVPCSDGRLYHVVLSAIALEVWEWRKIASTRGKAGAMKRWEKHRHVKTMAQAVDKPTRAEKQDARASPEHAQASGNNGGSNAPATKIDSREVKRSEDKRGLSESPTRGHAGQNLYKNNPEEPKNPEAIERNRRMGKAMADGDPDLARRIKEGIA